MRLGIAAVLAAAQMIIALSVVPGATVAAHVCLMVFVGGGPWLAALPVVRPAQLSRALKAAILGRTGDDLTTARVLEFLGGLTVTFGAIGALGSVQALFEAVSHVGNLEREAVPGAVAAAIMPPAFAVIVRLTLLEPVVWSVRRASPRTDAARLEPSRAGAGWKVALIVVATVVAVEGTRATLLGYLAPATPKHDTSVAVLGPDPAASDRRAKDTATPVRIVIRRANGSIECRVDGKLVGARPGRRDEIEEAVSEIRAKDSRRAFDIDVAPTVPVRHLVAAVDACVRVRVANAEDPRESAWRRGLRIRLLAGKPLGVRQRLRLVRRDWDLQRERSLLLVQLPGSETSEQGVLEEYSPPTISLRHDRDRGETLMFANRARVNLDTLKTWIRPIVRSRIDGKTGASAIPVLIRCDQDAPSQALLDLLVMLADHEVRVCDVLLEVQPRRR